jgi:cytochrome c
MLSALLWGLSADGILADGPPETPVLGQTAQAAPDWDFVVGRNGNGLPAGSGSSTQGEAVYREKCERCHGPEGRGATAQELVGGVGGLNGPHPDRTVGSYWPYAPPLFDYIRRAMPPDEPLSLGNDELYALVAYLLARNGIVGDGQTLDAESLARVRMPNRDGFRPLVGVSSGLGGRLRPRGYEELYRYLPDGVLAAGE